jgi:hypothetical protein
MDSRSIYGYSVVSSDRVIVHIYGQSVKSPGVCSWSLVIQSVDINGFMGYT